MATTYYYPNGNDGGWVVSTNTNCDDGFNPGNGLDNDVTGPNDTTFITCDDEAGDILNLDTGVGSGEHAIVDGDTITQVQIKVRATLNASDADSNLQVDLIIGGTAQGTQQETGHLTGSFVTYTLSTTGWDSDWTAAQIAGMQVRLTSEQGGMPSAYDVDVSEVEVIITYTAGATINEVTSPAADNYAATTDNPAIMLRERNNALADTELSNLVDDDVVPTKVGIIINNVVVTEYFPVHGDALVFDNVFSKAQRTRNKERSETLDVEDVNSQWIESNEQQIETIDPTDDSVEQRERNRVQADSIVVEDDATATYVPPGAVINNVTLQDLDSCTVTDDAIELRERNREQADNATATDSDVSYKEARRDQADTLATTDAEALQRERNRTPADAIDVEDVSVDIRLVDGELIETIDTTDDSVEERERNRLLADSIVVLDDKTATYVGVGAQINSRTLQDLDSCDVTDDSIELRLRDRDTLDSAVVLDDKTATYVPVGAIINDVTLQDLDSVSVQDINEQIRERLREQGEQADITDATAEYRTRTNVDTDSAAVTDQADPEAVRTRQITDSIDLSETVESVRERLRALSDSIDATDSVIVTLNQVISTRTLSDSLSVTDALIAQQITIAPQFIVKHDIETLNVEHGLERFNIVHGISEETS